MPRPFQPRFVTLAAMLAVAALQPSAPAQTGRAPTPPAPTPGELNEAARLNLATPRILIDRELNQRRVRLISLSGDVLELLDEAGRPFVMRRGDVLALAPDVEPAGSVEPDSWVWQTVDGAPSRPLGRIEFTDGQVLPGQLGEGEGESITWIHHAWGAVSAPLDEVARVILNPQVDPAGPGGVDDSVLLANGDRVDGFLASINGEVRIERDGRTTVAPLDSVARITIANPAVAPEGTWVWLYDGAAAKVNHLTVSGSGQVSLTPAMSAEGAAPKLESNDLRAISFDTARLRPLAALPMTQVPAATDAASSFRRWTPPAIVGDVLASALGAADIELPGPMSVDWTLPRGAERIQMRVELPPSCRVWGECDVVIEQVSGGQVAPVQTLRLSAATPVHDLTAPLSAGAASLRVTVHAGESGPIQDRAILRRPLVLVSEP